MIKRLLFVLFCLTIFLFDSFAGTTGKLAGNVKDGETGDPIPGVNIVIDAGPDFRQQMLREKIFSLRAIFLTHEHVDHVLGLAQLRMSTVIMLLIIFSPAAILLLFLQ